MTQAFPPRPLVAVAGGAEVARGSRNWQLAEEVGRRLVSSGHRVLTGGRGGVMSAAAQGARAASSYQAGDIVALLPTGESSGPRGDHDIVIPTGLGHLRNAIIARADALIAIGGGAGTLSEIAYAWMNGRLIIALRGDGWAGRLADETVDQRRRYDHIEDDCVRGANDAEHAVALLQHFLPVYAQGAEDG